MFQTIIGAISSFMYSKLLVILLIGAGVYFTVRTRFPQVRLFKNACGSVMEKPEDKGAISSFQALMVSTASRVGTGNIVGVSSAICIGGFGSVFWMWVIAITHIQNTEPNPPIQIADEPPIIFPVPTRDAVDTINA